MASIDAARALLARDGKELCARLLRSVAAAKQRLRQVPGLDVLDGPGVEPTKLVVLLAGTGANGYAVENDLVAAGMMVEMADRDTLVPIPVLADDEDQVARFVEAMIEAIERHRSAPRHLESRGRVVGRAADDPRAAGGVLRPERDGRRRRRGRPGQRGTDRAVPARRSGARPRRADHCRRP